MDRLDTLAVGESGHLVLEIVAGDEASQETAAQVAKTVQGRHILGLVAQASDQLPAVPEGPAVACRVKMKGGEASVQVVRAATPPRGAGFRSASSISL